MPGRETYCRSRLLDFNADFMFRVRGRDTHQRFSKSPSDIEPDGRRVPLRFSGPELETLEQPVPSKYTRARVVFFPPVIYPLLSPFPHILSLCQKKIIFLPISHVSRQR